MKKNNIYITLILICIMLALCACGAKSRHNDNMGVDFRELNKTGEWELSYATEYSVEEYGEFNLITVGGEDKFLLVPEGENTPSNIPEDVVVLKQPLCNTYLVSSSVMDMIREIDALDYIKLTGIKESGWYVEGIADKMKSGDIMYAGKYSSPDYELMLSKDCRLAIENTMINHNPEVKEKIEELGIPVLVERSSYEEHPLGRLEWIKLYGLLYDKEDVADEFYRTQIENLEPVLTKEKTDHTVAFFYIASNGAVNVRKPNDYIAKMIGLAGGEYILNDILDVEENSLSTTNMQMEDFYAAAKEADVLIYNSTIDGELENIDELLKKSELFKDFKAVKNGDVYCTSNNFFQKTTGVCSFIEDMNNMLLHIDNKNVNETTEEDYRFLIHLK